MTPRVMLDALEVLQRQPMTAWQLSGTVFCHHRTAARVLDKLHKMGQVHIVEWRRSRGSPHPVYAYGAGEDVERPEPLTDKEKKESAAKKVSVEEKDFAATRRRQLRRKIKVDVLTAAFFGVKK
jgi:hypothetical protein